MTDCKICGAETELFLNGTPLCLACSAASSAPPEAATNTVRVQRILEHDYTRGAERAKAALLNFQGVMGDIPSGIPHPDGAERIRQARRELLLSQENYLKANKRLQEFLVRGIVPDDLIGGDQ